MNSVNNSHGSPHIRPSKSLNDSHLINPLDEIVTIDNLSIKLGNLVLKIAHLTRGIFRLIKSVVGSLFAKSSKDIGEYCFTQQFNDSCHLSPLMNLKILQQLKNVGYDLSQMTYFTRRQWLGENQQMLISWHHLMQKICDEQAKERYPNLYQFISTSIRQAPIFPHFYDQDNNFPFKGLAGIIEFGEMPFFFIDIEDLKKVKFKVFCQNIDFEDMISEEDLGLKTAIVKDRGIYKIYNHQSQTFELVEELEWISVENDNEGVRIAIEWEKLPVGFEKSYTLPPEGQMIRMQDNHGLGFEEIGVVNGLGGGLKLPNQSGETHTYVPYQMSLIKLLFYASGIDAHNQPINKNHRMYPIVKEFQALMAECTGNLWNPSQIDKEFLFQYHLAEVFKCDRELFRQTQVLVDVFINNWANYVKVREGEYFNLQHNRINQLDDIDDYLLGKEQALAYYVMQNIRMAWYSSINPKVLVNSLELGLPDSLGAFTHEFVKSQLLALKQIRCQNGEIISLSFLDLWDKILAKVKDRTGDRTDFMSFDDHGWVVSFDEQLIEMQARSPSIHDTSLLNRLGIAGIESWWGSELNLWYKQPRKVEQLS